MYRPQEGTQGSTQYLKKQIHNHQRVLLGNFSYAFKRFRLFLSHSLDDNGGLTTGLINSGGGAVLGLDDHPTDLSLVAFQMLQLKMLKGSNMISSCLHASLCVLKD
jgi:hypothetical protein